MLGGARRIRVPQEEGEGWDEKVQVRSVLGAGQKRESLNIHTEEISSMLYCKIVTPYLVLLRHDCSEKPFVIIPVLLKGTN